MTLTLVKMLFCGQGMTNLIEVHDDGVESNPADFLALVDCGSSGNLTYPGMLLDYIETTVRNSRNRRLDLVVLSHQDEDHVNLIGLLARRLGPDSVVKAYRGGGEWEAGLTFWNEFLAATRPTDPVRAMTYAQTAPNYQSSYRLPGTGNIVLPPAVLGVLASHPGVPPNPTVNVRILMSDLTLTHPNVHNATSAVIVVDDGNFAVVLPGDATWETFDEINDLYEEYQDARATIPLSPVIGLALPHHGALATAAPGRNYGRLRQFGLNIAPRTIGASSGLNNTYGHPRTEVVDQFLTLQNPAPIDVVCGGCAQHYYQRCVARHNCGFAPSTDRGVYTTVSSINPGVNSYTAHVVFKLRSGVACDLMVELINSAWT